MVQRDQWDTSWGPKKLIFLIREIDDAAMAAASVESCRLAAQKLSGSRFGSVIDMCNRYAAYAAASKLTYISQRYTSVGHDLPKISIQSSLGSTKHRRMRRRRLSDPRPNQEGVREPICIRKK